MSALTPIYKTFGESDDEGPLTEDNFHSGESLRDGVSGQRAIDSSYENERDARVINSRSNSDLKEDDLDKCCS